MKRFLKHGGWLILGSLLAVSNAKADMAVLIQISDETVSLVRIEKTGAADPQTDHEATRQLMQRTKTNSLFLPEDEDKLSVRWFNAAGELVHHEMLLDPRYIHAPGSQERQLRAAIQLLRAPNDAVLLRVKPRGYSQFIELNV